MNNVQSAFVEIEYSGGRRIVGIGNPLFIYRHAEAAKKNNEVVLIKVGEHKPEFASYGAAS